MHYSKYKTLIALGVSAALHTAGAYASSSPYFINNTAEQLSYSENWSLSINRGNGDFNDDVTETVKKGETLTFDFNGEDTLTLISELHPNHGSAEVFVDEISVGNIDLYDPEDRIVDNVFTFSNYPAGNHQVSIVTLNNTYFMLDALYVEPNRANVLSFISDGSSVAEQGFSENNSNSGTITITDEGALFSGVNGRATAMQALTAEQKAQAQKGYTISFNAQVVSGSSNVVYLANNSHRFLPRLELDSEGQVHQPAKVTFTLVMVPRAQMAKYCSRVSR